MRIFFWKSSITQVFQNQHKFLVPICYEWILVRSKKSSNNCCLHFAIPPAHRSHQFVYMVISLSCYWGLEDWSARHHQTAVVRLREEKEELETNLLGHPCLLLDSWRPWHCHFQVLNFYSVTEILAIYFAMIGILWMEKYSKKNNKT